MRTIVFVHGTGVRQEAYDRTLAEIRRQAVNWEGVRVERCFWGERHGTRLRAGGASVPTFDTTRDLAGEASDPESDAWRLLLADALFELRLLSLIERTADSTPVPVGGAASDVLADTLGAFLHTPWAALPPPLHAAVEDAGISGPTFDMARVTFLPGRPEGDECWETVRAASEPLDDYRRVLARSLIARAVALRPGHDPDLPFDRRPLDEAAARITDELGGVSRGISDRAAWLGRKARAIASSVVRSVGTFGVARYRGRLTEASALVLGDILLYQTHGQAIRDEIAQTVRAHGPGVILLAHSLGGIAAVDLLAKRTELYPLIDLLVTVGSQSPFLYEIGALHDLPFKEAGDPLPSKFPDWLNFYDLSDFLSFIGQHRLLFGRKIRDILVSSRKPFPDAHGAYFADRAVWTAIRERLNIQER